MRDIPNLPLGKAGIKVLLHACGCFDVRSADVAVRDEANENECARMKEDEVR